ncbi:unnamed protein product, partial [Polarella glacialis]
VDFCIERLGRAEGEAAQLEALSRRDILGYQQMLASVHDWMSIARTHLTDRSMASADLSSVNSCISTEGDRFLGVAARLKASMLADHARIARQRGRLSAERQARISMKDTGRPLRCSRISTSRETVLTAESL